MQQGARIEAVYVQGTNRIIGIGPELANATNYL